MDIEIRTRLSGEKLNIWKSFLKEAELEADPCCEQTVLVWDEGELVATGSRDRNLLKCIAVSKERQGEGITATLLTALRKEAFLAGYRHLFLYTKPKNEFMFSSLFFYSVAKTDKVLLMEDKKGGINEFLVSFESDRQSGVVGACVMNCNPFTLGHRYLIEKAASECDKVYVFVLSEDKSEFSFKDRKEMVKRGTADLKNVSVLETGPYLISSATFPTYFLKDRDSANFVQCDLDIEIFTKYFAPHFNITRRYIGTEPISPMTDMYNQKLIERLPQKGVEVRLIERLEKDDAAVSASRFRQLLKDGDIEGAKKLVPKSTFDYITENNLL